ncbi:MAG: glutamate--tRNA ligase [bacterium]|nr:glutamate--tRNA ligase [bacterium]
MSVVTRFAPSPTGFLHIGGARTALFNWLYAKHHGGKFLVRVEDTDRKRSNQEAIDAIFKGMSWLGLEADGEPVFQFAKRDRHADVAKQLLDKGLAYHCYCTPEELETMREEARANKKPPKYDGRWRDRDPQEAPEGVSPVVRFKAPRDGETVVEDLIQGSVRVGNGQLDDMILLRADGTPTYMLSVVVDDHDMGITHILRGDDHLTNTFRQYQIYKAMGWEMPKFGHMPLIHGPDGAKLSKRHGALGVEAYEEMGFLSKAMCNYLLRLGWAHGDEEIIPQGKAIEWFDAGGIGKSPSRFDIQKLTHLNGHYIREEADDVLLTLLTPWIEKVIDRSLTDLEKTRIQNGMNGMKQRSKTLEDLSWAAHIYLEDHPKTVEEKADKILKEADKAVTEKLLAAFESAKDWTESDLEQLARTVCESADVKFGKAAQPLRAALTGRTVSPSVFDVMAVLGREESLRRLKHFL